MLGEITSEHGSIKAGLQELAGQLAQAQQNIDQEVVAVQHETLSRTSFVKSEMDARFSVAQSQQIQAQATAKAAKLTSERALLETEKIKMVQQTALMQAEQKLRQQVHEAQ